MQLTITTNGQTELEDHGHYMQTNQLSIPCQSVQIVHITNLDTPQQNSIKWESMALETRST